MTFMLGASTCSMNSKRMPPGASTNVIRRTPKRTHDLRSPQHSVATELSIEVVHEQRRTEKAFGGKPDAPL